MFTYNWPMCAAGYGVLMAQRVAGGIALMGHFGFGIGVIFL